MLEVDFDNEQSLAKYGIGNGEFAQSCDWLGEDVWFAHLVKSDRARYQATCRNKDRHCYCPTSNCRLGSGIALFIAMEKLECLFRLVLMALHRLNPVLCCKS